MTLARPHEDVDGISLLSRDPRLDLQSNHISPFSHLLAEILETIFIHNALDSCAHEAYSHSNPTTPSWVNVSYVCRHWRDTALNCQTLWTYIPTTSQRWTQELLARSQKAPLKIWIEQPLKAYCTSVLSTVKQLMNHAQRIQELHLHFASLNDLKCTYQILSKFSSRLPCLQHVEIKDLYLSEATSFFPFGGNIPALRTLMLEHCCMSWKSFEFSALTTLHLHSTKLPYPQILTMVEFLGMLCRMPHLVQLHVHDSLPSANDFLSSGELNTIPVIHLPRLSNMSIKAPISALNALLSCVDIPLTTKVELGCADTTFTFDDFTRLASLLAPRTDPCHDPTPAVPKFRSLTVDNKNKKDSNASFTFSTSGRACSFPSSAFSFGSDENTHLVVCYGSCIAFGKLNASATSSGKCHSFGMTTIRSIHLVGPVPLPYSWRDILTSYWNIRHIKLSECSMPNIASMLFFPSRDRSGEKGSIVQNEIFVPALEELELYRIVFSRKDKLTSGFDILCEAISTRTETRCRLVVKECRASTRRRSKALNAVGWWEDTQFKVTHLRL